MEIVLLEHHRIQIMKAVWNGVVLAESDDTVVIEGNHYFPADSVKKEFLVESGFTSFCGWKGTASYYSVTANGKTNSDCAWYYPEPNDAAAKIRGHVAFWKGVEMED
ncbi:uncharacterized protein conserved in bacteria [Cenarchaeum symbiosum A]|uniref:Uncharacterized protein conserved in bacteria n=1 Tax=Cenarchaeum symbiosum (strain A) TaxID=414004 RepID=A0RW10_CENSY|nr:uncharacterized protein conserved in bacteria [Cenarchaeum symbiosum A]